MIEVDRYILMLALLGNVREKRGGVFEDGGLQRGHRDVGNGCALGGCYFILCHVGLLRRDMLPREPTCAQIDSRVNNSIYD